MSTWTGRPSRCPVIRTSQGDSAVPGQRYPFGASSLDGGNSDSRAHARPASGTVPPAGSQRSVKTAVPATPFVARITSDVAAVVLAALPVAPPQLAAVRANAAATITVAVSLRFILVSTAGAPAEFQRVSTETVATDGTSSPVARDPAEDRTLPRSGAVTPRTRSGPWPRY
jgi:hypothetical protein